MRVGVPKEVKAGEHRVGLTPAAVQELTTRGHEVFVQQRCGHVIGFVDEHYQRAGANILATAEDVYLAAELIVEMLSPPLMTAEITRWLLGHPDPLQGEMRLQAQLDAPVPGSSAGSRPSTAAASTVPSRVARSPSAACPPRCGACRTASYAPTPCPSSVAPCWSSWLSWR